MDYLLALLLFIHFAGLAITMGSGIAFSQLAPSFGTSGEEKPALFAFGKILRRLINLGIGLLWLSGIGLILWKWSLADLPLLFWIKIACVVGLSATAGIGSKAYKKYIAGDTPASGRVALMGKLSAFFGLLSLALAILTFSA